MKQILIAILLMAAWLCSVARAQSQWSMGCYQATGVTPALPVSAIQWNGLTHVSHNSAQVNADGTLDLSTEQVSDTAVALVAAAHAHNVKVLLALANPWNGPATNFQQAVTNHLSALVTNIMTVVNTYGYDGVDIDWEPFNASKNGSAMTALAQALRLALGSRLLTIDFTVNDAKFCNTVQSSFDRINVMTYAMTGTWNAPNGLWYNAALHCSGSDSAYLSLDTAKTRYLAAGIPASKLNLGLPFYGTRWIGGVLAADPTQGIGGPRQVWQKAHPPTGAQIQYNSVLSLITSSNYTWDPLAMVPYINHLGTAPPDYWYITYDNPQSIQAKVQYIIAQNLGGWIIWNIGFDYLPGDPHPHPLLDAVQTGVLAADHQR